VNVTVPHLGSHFPITQKQFTDGYSPLLATSGSFCSPFAWQFGDHSFTVTPVSGNATTFAWREAEEELPGEEAARLLDMSEEALVQWSRRLEFPVDVGAEGAARFRREEIETLRTAFASTHSVEGAIREARRRLGG
jgi:hypothetical protein